MNKIKIVLLIFICFIVCGCSIDVDYYFDENSISSTINSEFTLNEFYEYENVHEDSEYISDEELKSNLLDYTSNMYFPALKNSDAEYKKEYLKYENNKALMSYSYKYDYNNFKDNYIFSECFDNFEFTEDEKYFNIRLSGNYKCEGDIRLNITSKNGIENSNSIMINGNTHSFDVYEEDNEIFFSILKNVEVESNKSSGFRIFTFVIIIILLISLFGLFKYLKIKENE